MMRACPTEHQEQVSLFAEMRLRGKRDPRWLAPYVIPNGGSRGGSALQRTINGKRLKDEGVKAGVPDIFVPVPCGRFCGLYVELKKRQGGRVSLEQRKFADELDPRYMLVIAHGAEDGIRKISNYFALGDHHAASC